MLVKVILMTWNNSLMTLEITFQLWSNHNFYTISLRIIENPWGIEINKKYAKEHDRSKTKLNINTCIIKLHTFTSNIKNKHLKTASEVSKG